MGTGSTTQSMAMFGTHGVADFRPYSTCWTLGVDRRIPVDVGIRLQLGLGSFPLRALAL